MTTMTDAELSARESYEPGSSWDRPDTEFAGYAKDALARVEQTLREALPRTVGEEEDADPADLLAKIEEALADAGETADILDDCGKALTHYDDMLWAVRSLAEAYARCDDSILPAAVQDFLDKVGKY